MKEIDKLNYRPFTRFCMSIGAVPTSYLAGLTIEEQLLWFCSYLEKEVIPAVNNNAEAVEELQRLYIELHDYVENYFENLDVTEEINNKLDEMAENGTLAKIIEDYATIPELTTRVSTLEDTTIPALSDRVTDIEEELAQKEKYLIIGDSYGAMSNDTWIDKIITLIGNKADCQKIALGGAGFAHISSLGYSFLTYLQHVESDVTDKDRVTKIIVGGGYNDKDNTYQEITAAITSFCNYCQTTYPNAKIYLACIGFNTALTTDGATIRKNIKNIVLPAYSANMLIPSDPIYIKNSDKILQNDVLIGADNVHPTSLGHEYLAKKLYPYIMTNSTIVNEISEKLCDLTYNNVNYQLKYRKDDEKVKIQSGAPLIITSFPANTNFESFGTMDGAHTNYIGDITFTDVYPSNNYQWFYNTTCSINCSEGNFRNVPCTVWLRYNRKLYVTFNTVNNGSYQTYSNVSFFSLNNFLLIEESI